jgi:hypothetical protein
VTDSDSASASAPIVDFVRFLMAGILPPVVVVAIGRC